MFHDCNCSLLVFPHAQVDHFVVTGYGWFLLSIFKGHSLLDLSFMHLCGSRSSFQQFSDFSHTIMLRWALVSPGGRALPNLVEVAGKQHAHCSCCTHYMLKSRSQFTTFARECVFGRYPTKGCFEHLASNSISNYSFILLYTSLSQGCVAAPNCC